MKNGSGQGNPLARTSTEGVKKVQQALDTRIPEAQRNLADKHVVAQEQKPGPEQGGNNPEKSQVQRGRPRTDENPSSTEPATRQADLPQVRRGREVSESPQDGNIGRSTIAELARAQGIDLTELDTTQYYIRRVAGLAGTATSPEHFQVVRKEVVDPTSGTVRERGGISDGQVVKLASDVVEPKFGSPEILSLQEIDPPYSRAMQERFTARAQHVQARELEKQQVRAAQQGGDEEQTRAELLAISARYQQPIVGESRRIGEIGAEAYMEKQYGVTHKVEKLYETAYVVRGEQTTSRSGDFDQVWRVTPLEGVEATIARRGERFIVIEAKGGGGELTTRVINGQIVRQGTEEYFDHTISLMASHGDKEVSQVGRTLRKAALRGNVEYLLVESPFAQQGNQQILGDIKVTPFLFD